MPTLLRLTVATLVLCAALPHRVVAQADGLEAAKQRAKDPAKNAREKAEDAREWAREKVEESRKKAEERRIEREKNRDFGSSITRAVKSAKPGASRTRSWETSTSTPGASSGGTVAQFDKDGDGRLNKKERQTAREALEKEASRVPVPPPGMFPPGPPRIRGPGVPRGGGVSSIPSPVVPFGGGAFPGADAPGLPAVPKPDVRQPKPGRTIVPADVPPAGDVGLYHLGTLRTLFLDFDSDDWMGEIRVFRLTNVVVDATLTVDGRRYPGVGVHSYDVRTHGPINFKQPLCIALDFTDPAQRLMGRRTLRLFNGNVDVTVMGAVLYSAIANAYLPAPKANFVRVVVNGEDQGVYQNVEAVDEDFAAAHYKAVAHHFRGRDSRSRSGLEDLGDEPGPYRRGYALWGKDDPKAWPKLIRLCKTLNQTPPDRLEAELAPMFDVDGALRFLALENALVNHEGYWNGGFDYSLVCNGQGVFRLVPERIERAFRAPPGTSAPSREPKKDEPPPVLPQLDPLHGIDEQNKPLRSRLLAVPALRDRYLEYVKTIAQDDLSPRAFMTLVAKCRSLIEADLAEDTKKLSSLDDFLWATSLMTELRADPEGQIMPLIEFAAQRHKYLIEYQPPPVNQK